MSSGILRLKSVENSSWRSNPGVGRTLSLHRWTHGVSSSAVLPCTAPRSIPSKSHQSPLGMIRQIGERVLFQGEDKRTSIGADSIGLLCWRGVGLCLLEGERSRPAARSRSHCSRQVRGRLEYSCECLGDWRPVSVLKVLACSVAYSTSPHANSQSHALIVGPARSLAYQSGPHETSTCRNRSTSDH